MSRMTRIITVAAFASASVLAYCAASMGASWIEKQSVAAISNRLIQNEITWAEVYADGLRLDISGTAPTEADRFRAMTIAGTVVDARRLSDQMLVADADVIPAPRFSLEILRNDRRVSLIGLVPADESADMLTEQLDDLNLPVMNMVETSEHDVSETWERALRFALRSLEDLPRSKISVEEDTVWITAITDSPAEKRNLEEKLRRANPDNIRLRLDISAPRPVITPFTMRVTKDESGVAFDACSVDSEEALASVIEAAGDIGFDGRTPCIIGLGTPSAAWGDATARAIRAMADLEGGTLTFSDADVTLIASSEVSQESFDAVVGRLDADLPDVFSLEAILTPKPITDEEAAKLLPEFIATLSPEGLVQMRGRLRSASQEAAVLSFARAHFGSSDTYIATQTLEELPLDWTTRVFAGLEALSFLHHGKLTVDSQTVTVTGVSGMETVKADISGILGAKLQQSERYVINVTYDETLDPMANIPTPAECVARLDEVLSTKKISFNPGAATYDAESALQISKLADAFEGCEYTEIEIGGHTDSEGSEQFNRNLSQARAEAVRTALIGQGVPTGSLKATGYGETQPIASNDTEEGREANRRIAFKVLSAAQPDQPTQEASQE